MTRDQRCYVYRWHRRPFLSIKNSLPFIGYKGCSHQLWVNTSQGSSYVLERRWLRRVVSPRAARGLPARSVLLTSLQFL